MSTAADHSTSTAAGHAHDAVAGRPPGAVSERIAGTIAVTAPPGDLVVPTDRGILTLRPVDPDTDLPLVHGWMHRPHVARFWRQAWPIGRLRADITGQLAGTASRPCLGLLAGVPVSYWEIYRPIADPLGRAYPAEPTDLGVHVLIGEAVLTGRGLGRVLLSAVRRGLLGDGARPPRAAAGRTSGHRPDAEPPCRRVVAEPDVRNVASVRAFGHAGFRRHGDVRLADKTAALMVAEREH